MVVMRVVRVVLMVMLVMMVVMMSMAMVLMIGKPETSNHYFDNLNRDTSKHLW